MHNNEEYYSFLYNIQGGEDLYERVLNTENLYRYGFYENVQHAARMFFECFVDNICRTKNIKPIQSNNPKQPINYTQTLKFIFEKSTIKDPEWYENNYIEDWYEELNESSHSKGLENARANALQENNETILYIIRDVCIWYYNHVGKIKRNFDGYNLPDKIDINNFLDKQITDCEKNREIDDSIRERYNVLLSQLKDKEEKIKIKEDDIKKLEYKNLVLQKDLNIINNDNALLNDKISILQTKLDKEDKNNIDNLIERLKTAQKEILEINFQKKEKNTIINQNKKEIAELKQLLKEKEEQIKYLENLKNKIINKSNIVNKDDDIQKIFLKMAPKTKIFVDRVLNVLKIMDNLGCYARMSTIFRFLTGEESRQSYYYPKLKDNELWGIYKNEEKFHYRYLEGAINSLLQSKTIVLNNDGNYEIVK